MHKFNPFFINSNIAFGKRKFSCLDDILVPVAGNTGNSYITYALIKTVLGRFSEIKHIENIYTYDFSKSDIDIAYVKNECSHIFLVLQDQIRLQESYSLQLPYREIISFIKKCNKPLVIAGLGHNSFGEIDKDFHKKLSPDLVWFLRELSTLCSEIGIRGEITKEILEKLGIRNSRVIGCPSFYEQGPNRIVKKIDLNDVRPVLTSQIAPSFLLKDPSVSCICQDYCESNLLEASFWGRCFQELSWCNITRLKNKRIKIFLNPLLWQNYLKNFNFAIGTRVHGSIMAINSGLTVVCTSGDNRAREMCEFMKIPRFVCLPSSSNEKDFFGEILDKIDMESLNDIYPSRFANYKDFILKQGLPFLLENLDSISIDTSEISELNFSNELFPSKMKWMTLRMLKRTFNR